MLKWLLCVDTFESNFESVVDVALLVLPNCYDVTWDRAASQRTHPWRTFEDACCFNPTGRVQGYMRKPLKLHLSLIRDLKGERAACSVSQDACSQSHYGACVWGCYCLCSYVKMILLCAMQWSPSCPDAPYPSPSRWANQQNCIVWRMRATRSPNTSGSVTRRKSQKTPRVAQSS